MYKKLIDMGGIDMNKDWDSKRKEYEKMSWGGLLLNIILTMLITLADITIRAIIIIIVVVKTLQWLGVL